MVTRCCEGGQVIWPVSVRERRKLGRDLKDVRLELKQSNDSIVVRMWSEFKEGGKFAGIEASI